MIDIVCILDKSGSMFKLQEDVISSINEFIEEQQKQDVGHLTMITFDTQVNTLYKRVPIGSVERFTEKDYEPSGMTALYDAIGTVLNDPQFKESKKGILVIHTDGKENSSTEYDMEGVSALIDAKKDWEIIFFGANLSSVEDAKKMGIENANKYENTKEGFKTMYRDATLSVSAYIQTNV